MTATRTVPQTPEEKQALRTEILRRRLALNWSQNELARRARYKYPGFVSKVLNERVESPGVWARLLRALDRAERRRSRVHAA